MIDGFGSLPFPATTAIVSMASAFVVLALSFVMRNRWLWVAAVVVPLAVAYGVYWMPVWIGRGDPSQASLWERLVMIAWGGSGVVACLILVAVLRRRVAKAR